ncbi:VanZ family protein [Paenibacillus eucommiae]|uniref:VanZ family protein n=1 Tax=Paenibacillus eucommiae TaxID=1355755 RepID=A0ABS4IRU4_9BACL|nr:VanZ family protein [Paenibacillus eucommiae]MBP1990287.1 VanZ family protein [Paenibacillus eucommiae]
MFLRRRWIGWILVIICCTFIFKLTDSPASTSKHTTSIIKTEIKASHSATIKINYIVRKSAHMTLFGILAICLLLALGKIKHAPLLSWALATAYGALDEIHQIFKPDRTAAAADVLIDSAGALLALLFFWGVRGLVAMLKKTDVP